MLLALNKPYGGLCQFSGDGSRPTLADFVREKDVYPAGRLDHDSEGLLLLPADGPLAHRLTGPAPDRALAGDAGCGNGQASVGLAAHFDRVVATDPSATQIAQAGAHPTIDYRVEPAERSSLEPGSVSLVSVSQALHWFDLEAFHAEVRRVGRPGAPPHG